MVKGLYTSATGMINEQRRVDVLANNLANSSTTGFKAEGSTSESFYDVLAYKIKDTSEPFASRRLGAMNLGVKIGETYTDYSEGSFVTTGNDYDMALSGKGFFAIEFTAKDGTVSTKYTRAGDFIVNSAGELVNKNGDYVLDITGQHIVLDPLVKPTMGLDGTIYQNGNAVATIQVQDFEDYNYLKKYGENYYDAIEGATLIESTATIYNGMLEASNVQTVKEMVNLINYQRAYETNQKMIQAHNETLEVAVNDLGKV
ncbi:MAG: flagellar hook-basal body protein [Lachnospiraceae bacterium]|nr:flagellar hook-basal body protein [Lachnospiraceae bacterium]